MANCGREVLRKLYCFSICLGMVVTFSHCGSDSPPASTNPTPLLISPSTVTLDYGQSQTFTTSGGTAPITFSVDSPGTGAISSSGVYTRPWAVGTETVRAVDASGNAATAVVTLPALGGIQLGASGATTTPTSTRAAVTDSSGNYYIYGRTTGSLGGFQYGSHGTTDAFVAKFSSAGTQLWVAQLGAAGVDTTENNPNAPISSHNSLLVDTNGNVYLFGQTGGNLGGTIVGQATPGQQDVFLLKLTSAGALGWVVQISGGSGIVTESLDFYLDASNNIFVAGDTQGGDLGVTPIGNGTVQGSQDGFIAKFNSSGTKQWIVQIDPGPSNLFPAAYLLDSSGNSYLAGKTDGQIKAPCGSHGPNDLWAVKVNSSGVSQYLAQWGDGAAGADIEIDQIVLDSSNNLYLSGYTNNAPMSASTVIGNATAGNQDFLLAQITSAGACGWSADIRAGVNSTSYSDALYYETSTNKLVLIGRTDGMITGATSSGSAHGARDLVVAKFSTLGAKQWINQMGAGGTSSINPTANNSNGLNTIRDSANNYIVQGVLDSSGSLGSGTLTGTHGNTDLFVAKFSEVAGVGQLAWAKAWGPGASTDSFASGLGVDGSNNVYFTAYTSGTFATPSGTHGNQDVAIGSVTSSGTVSWVTQLGSGASKNSAPSWPLVSSTGTTLMMGLTTGVYSHQLGTHGAQDAFLAKFSSTGVIQ